MREKEHVQMNVKNDRKVDLSVEGSCIAKVERE